MAKKKGVTKKQILVAKTKQKRRQLPLKAETVRAVAEKLLKLFKKHIGEENRISRMDLFYEVYSVSEHEVGELKAWFMWDIVRRACGFCRKYTRCKIISKAYKVSEYSTEGGVRYYFVASNMMEALVYTDLLAKCQKAMDGAKKRLKSAVRNGHHKDTSRWVMP